MIFKLEGFYIDLVESKDLNEVEKVYNSNKDFLLSHMDTEQITGEWVFQEIESMRKAGFYSCKIVEIGTKKIIGIIDFKAGEETYLSLLMIRNEFKNRGLGKSIFRAFEEYIRTLKSKCIRIDVATHYDNIVTDFWVQNQFVEFEHINLNWTGKTIPAIAMKKLL